VCTEKSGVIRRGSVDGGFEGVCKLRCPRVFAGWVWKGGCEEVCAQVSGVIRCGGMRAGFKVSPMLRRPRMFAEWAW